jgi:hypothetical protein
LLIVVPSGKTTDFTAFKASVNWFVSNTPSFDSDSTSLTLIFHLSVFLLFVNSNICLESSDKVTTISLYFQPSRPLTISTSTIFSIPANFNSFPINVSESRLELTDTRLFL